MQSNLHTSQQRVVLFLCSSLVLLVIASGCNSKEQSHAQQLEILQRSEELTRGYLQGDVEHATECLMNQAALLEEATVLEPVGRAQILVKTYERLYVLKKRTGDEATAGAYLIKARYWMLKYGELTRPEIGEVMEELEQISPEDIIEYIDGLDKKYNDGNPPNYVRQLNSESEP